MQVNGKVLHSHYELYILLGPFSSSKRNCFLENRGLQIFYRRKLSSQGKSCNIIRRNLQSTLTVTQPENLVPFLYRRGENHWIGSWPACFPQGCEVVLKQVPQIVSAAALDRAGAAATRSALLEVQVHDPQRFKNPTP
jgi:hypothetical protein